MFRVKSALAGFAALFDATPPGVMIARRSHLTSGWPLSVVHDAPAPFFRSPRCRKIGMQAPWKYVQTTPVSSDANVAPAAASGSTTPPVIFFPSDFLSRSCRPGVTRSKIRCVGPQKGPDFFDAVRRTDRTKSAAGAPIRGTLGDQK